MLLGVNIDHVATLRNARGGVEPDVLRAAEIAIASGADGITVHLREDRRHIKDEDVFALKKNPKIRLNLEMAMTEEMQKIALELNPDAVCIVPEKREELTTEGGLDVESRLEYAKEFIKPLVEKGIMVSLFIDPDINQVSAAYQSGAQFIELHTGKFAEYFNSELGEQEFLRLQQSAAFADTLGLKVNAGHGLNYVNVLKMLEIPNLVELNIGHSIVSQAVFLGLGNAIKEMKEIIE